MPKKLLFVLSLAVCFTLGFAFHKYTADLIRNYLGVSASVLIKSPGAVLRTYNKGWDYFESLQYTSEKEAAYTRRYAETALLPLVIDGKRLSDFYRAPKIGGAITSVGGTIVILDRLGGLYRYDPITSSF